MVATMTPSTQVPVLLKITTMLMMVVVIMTMTLNIITIAMVLISAIIIIIIVVMIIIIRATRMRPAPPPRPPWNAKLNPGPSSPLVTVSFASWGWWGGARFEGFVPGAGCPLGLPLAILATRFSMCGGDEANYVDGRY